MIKQSGFVPIGIAETLHIIFIKRNWHEFIAWRILRSGRSCWQWNVFRHGIPKFLFRQMVFESGDFLAILFDYIDRHFVRQLIQTERPRGLWFRQHQNIVRVFDVMVNRHETLVRNIALVDTFHAFVELWHPLRRDVLCRRWFDGGEMRTGLKHETFLLAVERFAIRQTGFRIIRMSGNHRIVFLDDADNIIAGIASIPVENTIAEWLPFFDIGHSGFWRAIFVDACLRNLHQTGRANLWCLHVFDFRQYIGRQ